MRFVCVGAIDYWGATSYKFPEDLVNFDLKMDTNLFELARLKTSAKNMEVKVFTTRRLSQS